MRIALIFILSLNLQLAHASDFNYNEIRHLYVEATDNEEDCHKLFKLTEASTLEENAIAYSYHAVSKMLRSKFSLNILYKYSEFNSGKEMLEKAISSNPNNLELRFLRYCIQKNVPGILNYNDNLDSDSVFISTHLQSKDVELRTFINPIFNAL